VPSTASSAYGQGHQYSSGKDQAEIENKSVDQNPMNVNEPKQERQEPKVTPSLLLPPTQGPSSFPHHPGNDVGGAVFVPYVIPSTSTDTMAIIERSRRKLREFAEFNRLLPHQSAQVNAAPALPRA